MLREGEGGQIIRLRFYKSENKQSLHTAPEEAGEGGSKVSRAAGTEVPMRNAVWFKAVLL